MNVGKLLDGNSLDRFLEKKALTSIARAHKKDCHKSPYPAYIWEEEKLCYAKLHLTEEFFLKKAIRYICSLLEHNNKFTSWNTFLIL